MPSPFPRHERQPSPSLAEGRRTCRLSFPAEQKIRQGEPALVSPCTHFPLSASARRRAAGVKFLLLHLPLYLFEMGLMPALPLSGRVLPYLSILCHLSICQDEVRPTLLADPEGHRLPLSCFRPTRIRYEARDRSCPFEQRFHQPLIAAGFGSASSWRLQE